MQNTTALIYALSPEVLRMNPKRFALVFGVSVAEFDAIVVGVKAERLEQLKRELVLWDEPRISKIHSRSGQILSRDVAITLLYQRQYMTQEVLGACFGMDQGSICTIIQRTEVLLAATLPTPERLSEALADVVEEMPAESFETMNLAVIIDGAEQVVQRPKDAEVQGKRYSGKKNSYPQDSNNGNTRRFDS